MALGIDLEPAGIVAEPLGDAPGDSFQARADPEQFDVRIPGGCAAAARRRAVAASTPPAATEEKSALDGRYSVPITIEPESTSIPPAELQASREGAVLPLDAEPGRSGFASRQRQALHARHADLGRRRLWRADCGESEQWTCPPSRRHRARHSRPDLARALLRGDGHSFTKIVVVLSLIRNALGLQQVPPTSCSTASR
ncbi:fliP family domain-containing protein [Ditylenchus destructor]|uniref:FliP family domain-containing protein n=1 Tax=Ditylenchus destructor TaxID=166010 RepID=A0AAD4MIZ3_9BILA|nr:fliP family domain-containing protein [Ditylenchus destructor]